MDRYINLDENNNLPDEIARACKNDAEEIERMALLMTMDEVEEYLTHDTR